MTTKNISISQAVSFGWSKTKDNFWLMIAVAIILILAGSLPGIIWGHGFVWSYNIISWILTSLVGVGLIKIVLKLYQGKKVGIEYFSKLTWQQFLDYLVVSLLQSVITIVGLILLIIPGIIFSLRYQFAVYLLLDKNLGPIESLKKSWQITKGYFGVLFGLWVISLFIILLGFLVFGIGLLVAVPVVIMAQTYVYKQLVK